MKSHLLLLAVLAFGCQKTVDTPTPTPTPKPFAYAYQYKNIPPEDVDNAIRFH